MKRVAFACLVVACKREPEIAAVEAAASVEPPPVVTEAPAPSETAAPSATPPASASAAPHARFPATAGAIPAAWLTCARDADCVTLPSACCGAWPSNAASEARVKAAVAAADAARDFCRNRLCAMREEMPACENGRCVVR